MSKVNPTMHITKYYVLAFSLSLLDLALVSQSFQRKSVFFLFCFVLVCFSPDLHVHMQSVTSPVSKGQASA